MGILGFLAGIVLTIAGVAFLILCVGFFCGLLAKSMIEK